MLKRKVEKDICQWIETGEKALLVYGVRQAGKTFVRAANDDPFPAYILQMRDAPCMKNLMRRFCWSESWNMIGFRGEQTAVGVSTRTHI